MERVEERRSGMEPNNDGALEDVNDDDLFGEMGFLNEVPVGSKVGTPALADVGLDLPSECPAELNPAYYFTPQVASVGVLSLSMPSRKV